MNKILNYIHLGITAVILLVLIFGGSSNFGGTTNYDQLDTTDGYSVDSTTVIDGSGNLSLTGSRTASVVGGVAIGSGGTTITKKVCNSRNYDAPQLSINGTTTIDIALTGATSTSAQVYTGTFGTSSLQYYVAGISTTSTANYVTVMLLNYGPQVDPATSTLAVCYEQF